MDQPGSSRLVHAEWGLRVGPAPSYPKWIAPAEGRQRPQGGCEYELAGM